MTDPVDLQHVPVTGDGVAWSAAPEGVNANLVALGPGGHIAAHRNDEVEVLVVVLDGSGCLAVDDAVAALGGRDAVVVPRGAVRAIRAGDGGLRYLTVHRARGPLAIQRREGGDG
jgi:quercetin dioxygenase-like cupin family protein